jgi:exonuclease III
LFLRFDSYSVYYKPRERNPTRGGGVAILVNNSLMNRRINGLDNKLEIIGVKIETIDLSFNLISYYEPNGNELSPQAVEDFLELGPNLILVGDLNSRTSSIGCKGQNANGLILEEILINPELLVIKNK